MYTGCQIYLRRPLVLQKHSFEVFITFSLIGFFENLLMRFAFVKHTKWVLLNNLIIQFSRQLIPSNNGVKMGMIANKQRQELEMQLRKSFIYY
jgi:hypothetical protein